MGACEDKSRFHGIKQRCGGRGKEGFGVPPETGDVYDPTHNLTFTYDVLDRLIKSSGSLGRTYAYDANGNRTLDKKGTTQTD